MDVSSLPPTRSGSPGQAAGETLATVKEDSDRFARKAGLGNLMKTAKQDVKVPEFDMSAFF